jgi:hypothetical protein
VLTKFLDFLEKYTFFHIASNEVNSFHAFALVGVAIKGCDYKE